MESSWREQQKEEARRYVWIQTQIESGKFYCSSHGAKSEWRSADQLLWGSLGKGETRPASGG